tara:strand:+ start:1063 stop:1275 length:213 start_codon:yes stop_codon:yes gene_type:complete
MFKLFTSHLTEKKKNYLQHAWFALKVSVRLSLSSTFFFVHALFPFVKIPYDLNLESTALYLFERNNELED